MEPSKSVKNNTNVQTLNKESFDVKLQLNSANYSIGENIGCGAYGVVCSAVDNRNGERVAIKKIPRIFDNLILAKRTYREIKILQHFKHDNVIHIRELLTTSRGGVYDFSDVCIVFDLMETDLHQLIRSRQELSDEHVRYFLYQILRGLKYIHSANVLHRDLKPGNLLVNGNCDLKIGDFGMARPTLSSEQDHSLLMTHYVATRWYRSPELMLFRQQYTAAVDVWSVGCIFAEMLGRKPLFPGKNLLDQIMLVIGVLGSPTDEFISMAHTERIKDFLSKLEKKESIPFPQLYPTAGPKALRLLEKLLRFDPRQRISVDNALNDLYLNKYHDPADEPICQPTFGFDFEKQDMDEIQLRSLIYQELKQDGGSSVPTAPSFNIPVSVETMDVASPSIVFADVQLQDVAMLSAKNSPELVSAEVARGEEEARLKIVSELSVNEQPVEFHGDDLPTGVLPGGVLPAGVLPGGILPGEVFDNALSDLSARKLPSNIRSDLASDVTNPNGATTKPVEFSLVPDYGKTCKNIDYSVDGITVARMQSWKILPSGAKSSGGNDRTTVGKDKPCKRAYRRKNNYGPVSTINVNSGAPVNVKEALRAVLLSESRDFRTKAAKLKSKSQKADCPLTKKEFADSKKLKHSSSLLLTEEDKSLLSRWMDMQKVDEVSTNRIAATEASNVSGVVRSRGVFTASQNYVKICPKTSATSQSLDDILPLRDLAMDRNRHSPNLTTTDSTSDEGLTLSDAHNSNFDPTSLDQYKTAASESDVCCVCSLNKNVLHLINNSVNCKCSSNEPAVTSLKKNDLSVKTCTSASLSDCDIDSAKLSGLVKTFLPSASVTAATLDDFKVNVVYDYSIERFENSLTLNDICVQSSAKPLFDGTLTDNPVVGNSWGISNRTNDINGSSFDSSNYARIGCVAEQMSSADWSGLSEANILCLGKESAELLSRWLQQDSQSFVGEDLETILMKGTEENGL